MDARGFLEYIFLADDEYGRCMSQINGQSKEDWLDANIAFMTNIFKIACEGYDYRFPFTLLLAELDSDTWFSRDEFRHIADDITLTNEFLKKRFIHTFNLENYKLLQLAFFATTTNWKNLFKECAWALSHHVYNATGEAFSSRDLKECIQYLMPKFDSPAFRIVYKKLLEQYQ